MESKDCDLNPRLLSHCTLLPPHPLLPHSSSRFVCSEISFLQGSGFFLFTYLCFALPTTKANLENVFCHGSKIPILTSIAKDSLCLKRIVKLDSACSEEEKTECTQLGIELISLGELEVI